MKRLSRFVPLLLAIPGALPASSAAAVTPSAANSSIPGVIILVGTNGSTPDPHGLFQVVVRDGSNLPIAGARVSIEFTDTTLTVGKYQTHPGVSVQCLPPVVSALTDASGIAQLIVTGGVAHRSQTEPTAPSGIVRAQVGADPAVVLGTCRVAAFDQNGVNGVENNDVELFECDRSCLIGLCYRQRSDYDGDGLITFSDLPFILSAVNDRGSPDSAPRCDQASQLALSFPPDASLDLAWSNCRSSGGVVTQAFDCGSAGHSFKLVGTAIVPSGVTQVTGWEAELEVIGDVGSPLPEWWRFDAAGCRAGMLVTGTLSGTCPTFAGCTGSSTTAIFPSPGSLPNQERLQVRSSLCSGVTLTAGQHRALFELDFDDSQLAVCSGCDRPVAIALRSLRLNRGTCSTPNEAPLPDVVIINSTSASGAVAFWQGTPSGFQITGVGGEARRLWLGSPAPQPSAGPATIRFGLAHEARVSLGIFDVTGRCVRELASGRLPAGAQIVRWDGRDDRGSPVGAGVYFVRLVADGQALSRTLVRVR